MALSNTAVPKYYGMFRDAVIRGEIPVNKEISMEMNRIDDLIANPGVYYDDKAVEGFILYCENELTLTDGSDLNLLDSFKVWSEQIFGWYYFVERSVYEPSEDGHGGHYVKKHIRKRLINKQYLIVARGAAKSMYGSCLQNYFLNVDITTTHQITTAPTMKQAEEVLSPIRTAITRSRGPFYKFLTDGSIMNTSGSKANRVKLASTKKGIENFLTGSLLEIRPMRIDKLQGLQLKVATVDEWLSGDIREDVIGAIEQGASKVDDYLIVAISSEGTVRNGAGDTIKMELQDILKGEYIKHNVFENGVQAQDNTLSHADQVAILETAKMRTVGTFKNALQMYAEENALQHDATSSGVATGDLSKLFPEYAEVRPGAPELITNDQGWISTVISKVHKSPMSRIRTTQADIRNIDTLKAHGYQKGKQKKLAGNFNLVRRTTDPQTIYVRNALNRDDIVDITDFDYVAYLYSIDRMSLNEELAKAIMIGDGRDDGAEDKIFPEHIRPIWLDDDLYTIHTDLDITTMKAELQGTNTGANFGDNYVYAEAMVQTLLYARENYKGTGTPDLYCTPHMANVMLLARDLNGRRIYSSKAELATALNVGSINTAEQFANKTRKTSDGKTKKLIALVVNLQDYSLGATKGGEITHFTQFDIDFNQEKSLLETRCSGALTRVYSAIAIEEDVTDTKGQQTGDLAG